MLSEREIRLVVTSAMSRYAAENDDKRGLTKKDIISAVVSFGGNGDDVTAAMIEGLKRLMPEAGILLS